LPEGGNKMIIQYDRIFLDDLKMCLSNEKMEEIRSYSMGARKRVDAMYPKASIAVKFRKGIEFAYLAHVNQDKSDLEKALIASNFGLTNERFAEMLKDSKFDREYFETYLKLLKYTKARLAQGVELNEKDTRIKNKVELETKRLVNYFSKINGLASPEVIINKINEILSYQPELLRGKVETIMINNNGELKKDFANFENIECVYYHTNKDDNYESVNLYCVCDGDTISTAIDLPKLAEVYEKLVALFGEKGIAFNSSTLTIAGYEKLINERPELNAYNNNVIYLRNKSNFLIKSKVRSKNNKKA
jgi:hypothetical protein